jgi:hypothetical protein
VAFARPIQPRPDTVRFLADPLRGADDCGLPVINIPGIWLLSSLFVMKNSLFPSGPRH